MISRVVSPKRSVVKAISYRLVIVVLDFTTIWLFTGRIRVALGFMLASNVYTTVAYVLHERAWAHSGWGISESAPPPPFAPPPSARSLSAPG
jgi:uncharacterized membrane protein